MNWLKSQKINFMRDISKKDLYATSKQYHTKDELNKAIIKSWEEITIQLLQALVNSMPKKIFKLIKLNGAKTKY